MHVHKLAIKNFRLLEDVELLVEPTTTVIVGRNNSGKTSLTEVFRRLLSTDASPSFRLEDFSLFAHDKFWEAFVLKAQNKGDDEIRPVLPVIEVRLTVRYAEDATSIGPLSDYIIDLNPDCSEAVIVIRYQLRDGGVDALFEDLTYDENGQLEEQKTKVFRKLKERLSRLYTAVIFAIDPNDDTNRKDLDFRSLRTLMQSSFINAQRGLDDVTHRDRDVLGKVLEALLTAAESDSANPDDQAIVERLAEAVENIQTGIDEGFNKQLVGLLPAFSLFGYPGLSDPGLLTETTLDVKRLLTDHTRVHYAGLNGVNLPEAYNGLGARNLVFILLKLLEFYKAFMATPVSPGLHLVFIEEPEVHLHPQMQEVFISKLASIVAVFTATFNKDATWPVQFIVTTHSSHVANRADFECTRYFMTNTDESVGKARSTVIKDLRKGLSDTSPSDRDFLHKYMTLTRCDLLFADKAVLIEGPTERILLPKMIAKVELANPDKPKLSSQYVSVVEVGGAYAHLFFDLLNFLELKTLIITDLDTVKPGDNNRLVACRVSEGTRTSNACLKAWFDKADITPEELIGKKEDERTKDNRFLAYELPHVDGDLCGRSFEDAFMLANPALFTLHELDGPERESKAWEAADSINTKTDFALEYAIEKTEWVVPRYITEGLRWLARGTRHTTLEAVAAPATAAAASEDSETAETASA